MSSGSDLFLTRVLKRSIQNGEFGEHDVERLKQWKPDIPQQPEDPENEALFLELLERYKDNPHIREVVLPKLQSFQDTTPDESGRVIPLGLNIQPLLILLLKQEVKTECSKTLFETFRALSIDQELKAKEKELEVAKADAQKELNSMREHVKSVISSVGEVGKVMQERDNMKNSLFDSERRVAALTKRLEDNTANLCGTHQSRVHQMREHAMKQLNDEYMKLIHHIRGELRKTPIDKERLLEGINEHTDNMRLCIGQTII